MKIHEKMLLAAMSRLNQAPGDSSRKKILEGMKLAYLAIEQGRLEERGFRLIQTQDGKFLSNDDLFLFATEDLTKKEALSLSKDELIKRQKAFFGPNSRRTIMYRKDAFTNGVFSYRYATSLSDKSSVKIVNGKGAKEAYWNVPTESCMTKNEKVKIYEKSIYGSAVFVGRNGRNQICSRQVVFISPSGETLTRSVYGSRGMSREIASLLDQPCANKGRANPNWVAYPFSLMSWIPGAMIGYHDGMGPYYMTGQPEEERGNEHFAILQWRSTPEDHEENQCRIIRILRFFYPDGPIFKATSGMQRGLPELVEDGRLTARDAAIRSEIASGKHQYCPVSGDLFQEGMESVIATSGLYNGHRIRKDFSMNLNGKTVSIAEYIAARIPKTKPAKIESINQHVKNRAVNIAFGKSKPRAKAPIIRAFS